MEHKEQFQHIKSLYIKDVEMEECEVSWILQADYSKLWEALPNLEKLTKLGLVDSEIQDEIAKEKALQENTSCNAFHTIIK